MTIVKAKTLISASRLLLHLLDNPETEALNLEPGDQRSKPWDSGSNLESWQPYSHSPISSSTADGCHENNVNWCPVIYLKTEYWRLLDYLKIKID